MVLDHNPGKAARMQQGLYVPAKIRSPQFAFSIGSFIEWLPGHRNVDGLKQQTTALYACIDEIPFRDLGRDHMGQQHGG